MSFLPTTDQQARYAIAMLANLGQQYSGSDAATNTLNDITARLGLLQAKIGTQAEIGTWSVVWGPALYSYEPSTTPDAIMYVAQQANTNHYAIGIAGTNFSGSLFDLLCEDLWVDTTVPWILGGAPPRAVISAGTCLGLAILLNTPASARTPQVGVKLVDFLKAESNKGPLNISVCGHSLGGALAPTLALLLQNIKGVWDQGGRSRVMTMPIAGPTAGNDIFAFHSNLTVTTEGFYNSLDLVPHAWASSGLDKLATLYGTSDVVGGLIVGIVVGKVKPIIEPLKYMPTWRTELKGTLQPGKNYFEQGGYQHIYAYDDLFGFDHEVLHPKNPMTYRLSASLADAVRQQRGTIPPDVQIVPRLTKEITVGKITFKVPASADVEPIRQAVAAIAPYFGDALRA